MQPSISTKKLLLRPIVREDAGCVQILAGHPKVAEMTENIPHPYENGLAESHEGTLIDYVLKNGRFEDIKLYSIVV